jgi:hypothetical protein
MEAACAVLAILAVTVVAAALWLDWKSGWATGAIAEAIELQQKAGVPPHQLSWGPPF